eukprot:TRINITY_DN19084_c0_g1_i1.p1 TRINITY_DN19084_c0_g1~~TRINITY_DN19084_c0_g1_i1.p1  ORF type:complete len:348 (-),score=48.38 TRINITY_DN19084_c0_g1_i1:266-1309(-)
MWCQPCCCEQDLELAQKAEGSGMDIIVMAAGDLDDEVCVKALHAGTSTHTVLEILSDTEALPDLAKVPAATLPTLADLGAQDLRRKMIELPERETTSGATYQGQWIGPFFHGQGVLKQADGSVFEGQFDQGQAHGHGRLQNFNGNTYIGQWCQDQPHGDGEYNYVVKSADGDWLGCRFKGQWEHGQMHGQGQMDWPDGSTYEGGIKYDVREGEGTHSWPDGQKYAGQWVAGKPHGKGEIIRQDGKAVLARWADGTFMARIGENGEDIALPTTDPTKLRPEGADRLAPQEAAPAAKPTAAPKRAPSALAGGAPDSNAVARPTKNVTIHETLSQKEIKRAAAVKVSKER